MTFTLFEVSWEVCNKVGGIHTVISTKAKTLVERFGDEYVAIGPWLLGRRESGDVFEEERGHEAFVESCRALGVPVRVGRWKIPGRPLVILVEFTGLYGKKNDILSDLWSQHGVDSITGGWDYDEPVIFGWAAAMVIERWCHERVSRTTGFAVAQFHEWMTGSGLLYLKQKLPAIGTVFTTHATILGRSLSHGGTEPAEGLKGRKPEDAAGDVGVRSKHSMEAACAQKADVFTTVSEITAREAELLLGRKADPLLPNGIDLSVIDELAGPVLRDEARERLLRFASRFLGRDVTNAALLVLSGRYEFHNKGIDLLLEALAQCNTRPGREIVVLLAVPAGQSGVAQALRERLEHPETPAHGALGVSTHNLIDPDNDPIQKAAVRLGLANAAGSRVTLVQVPIYLHAKDGLFDLPYEAVLRTADLSLFPSFYEPWGYTPEESLAVGVPTVTTDLAGFGLWARAEKLGRKDGVWLLDRAGIDDVKSTATLATWIDEFVAGELGRKGIVETCRRTAQRTAWSDLVKRYYTAFDAALEAAKTRVDGQPMARFRSRVPLTIAPAVEGKRPRLYPFEVSATLPRELAGLERLSRNVYWCWDPEGTSLFEEISTVGWDSSGHNPVLFLRMVFPEDLESRARDPKYVAKLERVLARFDRYMASKGSQTWGAISAEHPVAYFCAEFGLHESLKVYSGGLGILAGDHLKSASDIGLPLVAVGLFYHAGYLRQKLSAAGDQMALPAENDPRNLPIELVRDANGAPVEVQLQLPSATLFLRAWRVQVGRVDLYLLDSDYDKNRAEDRAITQQLYGGDHEHRLRQELVLGRGGVKLLGTMGVEPSVFHINEGHAAFLVLSRTGKLIRDHGLTFDEARELVRSTTVFTTHTPVPAGHDRFAEDLMRRYFSDVEGWLGVTWERFLSLGQAEEDRANFNMTYLAMGFAGFTNGVSKLHGEVSKDLLRPYWPRLLRSEVPVRSVTNGVHLSSWMHPELQRLCGGGAEPIRGADVRERAAKLDPRALWAARTALRARFLAHARASIERAFVDRHDSPALLAKMLEGLDPDALLVGFARRFAPYKRADLVLRDLERLKALFTDPRRPVRLFFAGKAHPRDTEGQKILRKVVEITRSPEFAGRIFFLEDYDIELARALVQGVDVWLNNPIRSLEASGTSGMKVAANGGLNLSIADGWWIEGYDGTNGWTVGEDRVWPNPELQDEIDSRSVVELLQRELAPLYFERDGDGVPRRWMERALRSLGTIPAEFNTDRMVSEYRDRAYAPMSKLYAELSRDRCAPARALAAVRARSRKAFGELAILEAQVSDLNGLRVGDTVEARVKVDLAGLAPSDVTVELVLGHSKDGGELRNPVQVALQAEGALEGKVQAYHGTYRIQRSGNFAYGLRVRIRPIEGLDDGTGDLVRWA
ncbi:MAG: alpha-glucan family phosphorylase [Planctomycetota bacterium]|nr:alpha-glucan family phosphorylase [Planctomycetota bacterium]